MTTVLPDGSAFAVVSMQLPKTHWIENLRECTSSQNQSNRNVRISPSGRKWVYFVDNGKIRASISVNGKTIYLGNYQTIDEAAHAYNKAAIFYKGEFARLNPVGFDKE